MFTIDQANHANYATAGISLLIFLARIVAGRWRRRSIDLAFYLVLASIASVTARIALNHYVLYLGTSSDAVGRSDYFETHTPDGVVKGSKIILASRVAITTSLWLQICLLLCFYSQIMYNIPWVRIMISTTWFATGLSYVGVIVATFVECRPFSRYWQIDPSPGTCVKAYGQLLSQCISNIILDLMLLVISFPILAHRGRSWTQAVRVGALFTLGTFCLVVTIMRLTAVYGNRGQQAVRTLWGAVQIIVSAFVANMPTIYGDCQVMIRKRQEVKKRRLSRPESWTRSDGTDDIEIEDPTLADYSQSSNKKDFAFSEESHNTDTTTISTSRGRTEII